MQRVREAKIECSDLHRVEFFPLKSIFKKLANACAQYCSGKYNLLAQCGEYGRVKIFNFFKDTFKHELCYF